jgi:hypothetical protein
MKEDKKEGIAYGFTGHKDAPNIQPYPPTGSINLDPLLEKARQIKLSAEKKTKIYKSIEDDTIEVTENDIDDLVDELEIETKPSIDLRKKSYEETKKIVDNFRDKMANPPKYMSYEGSMVICVLLSMSNPATVRMKGLPAVDQELIKSLFNNDYGKEITCISVQFDYNKDFACSYVYADKLESTFVLVNTVAHPRDEDLKGTTAGDKRGDVPVENDGDKIAVGNTIVIDKKNIKKLMGIDVPADKKEDIVERSVESSIIKTTNRNAYEIRSDVLKMAIEWSMVEDRTSNYKKPTDDQLLNLARKFYQFVENKRY